MNTLSKIYQVVRINGVGFCVYRAGYAFRKKTGLLKKRFPAYSWDAAHLADWVRPGVDATPVGFLQAHGRNGRKFFFDGGEVIGLNRAYQAGIVAQAEQVLKNELTFFFDRAYGLGDPPDWFLNPHSGKRIDSGRHWCDVDFFEVGVGDIKWYWEPSRFAWCYTLVRAYAATDDERYVEKFWELLASWQAANRANIGPNFSCGQECAIRLMAMTFAYYALAGAKASTPDRMAELALAIAIHADRIEKNIEFAISTRTNHSLTEAAGIYTAGLLFPEFAQAERWCERGKRILTTDGLKQIAPDGGYIQHSMNYHRLMLQDMLWALRLAELNRESWDSELVGRVRAATAFLYSMQDDSGRVPNYGANDGALIVPLNTCDYLDYRPVIGAAQYFFTREQRYAAGPWDEDLLWLFGHQALQSSVKPQTRPSAQHSTSGYYTLRNPDNWAMMRCHSFRERPGHADTLHVDLWWRGLNILRDSGSYMYNCDEPWQSGFPGTAMHNTVVIDGQNQMPKIGRFMWADWTKARFLNHKQFDLCSAKMMVGEHYGYHRLGEITHRRAVLTLDERYWVIVDDILGAGAHVVILGWHLINGEHQQDKNQIRLTTDQGPAGLTVLTEHDQVEYHYLRGNQKAAIGWQSLYYGSRQPAPTFITTNLSRLPIRWVTVISLGQISKEVRLENGDAIAWQSETDENYAVVLDPVHTSATVPFLEFSKNGKKYSLKKE